MQGFLEKLGYTKSYLLINAFVYGIYNQNMALPHLNDPDIQAYRQKWLEAAFAPGKIEAVVTFGTPAFNAWTTFKATPVGQTVTAFHRRALHPTADKPGGPITRKDLLDNWNIALQALHAENQHPDVTRPLVPVYRKRFHGDGAPGGPKPGFSPWASSPGCAALISGRHCPQRRAPNEPTSRFEDP